MEQIGQYTNGNYEVIIFEDGTKIRQNNLDYFDAKFPENIDIKITNYCDRGCLYCHENSTTKGKHGNFNWEFINTLEPHTELAIGGGNPLSHPQLEDFLIKLQGLKLIPNITIHVKDFVESFSYIKKLQQRGLLYGIGVSLSNNWLLSETAIDMSRSIQNVVFHVINGIMDVKTCTLLCANRSKVLVLGYKNWGRGESYKHSPDIELKQDFLKKKLQYMMSTCSVVSFDNLALEQLKVQEMLTDEQWNTLYMGDDGEHTMYIDLVKGEFALNSTSPTRYPLTNNISDMFATIKEEKRNV